MKRLKAPRALKLHRKEQTWTIRTAPGPHPIEKSIPLGMIIRDYLELADNLRETKRILSSGEVIVDGAIRKDYKFPCGLMDVISITKMKKDYCPYCKRKELIQIFDNKFKCLKCGGLEEQETLLNRKYKLTTIKP